MGNKRVAIIIANFYNDICRQLLQGAEEVFKTHQLQYDIKYVDGALEIPIAMQLLCGQYDGFLALGCVIRGETYHFEIVAGESARGIMNFGMDNNKPVANGILTTENMAQAVERADPQQMNKGGGAADALLALFEIIT